MNSKPPTRKAAVKANEQINAYTEYRKANSDSVRTPVAPDDKKYIGASVAQQKQCGKKGGFVAGSSMHYDHGYNGDDEKDEW